MIRLLELYPEHLNLNGDRGNILVLQRRLQWAELEVEVFTHRVGQPLPATAPDFVLLGHGSPAAWKQIYADWVRIAPTIQSWLANSTQLLAVSSGYAALHGLFAPFSSQISRLPRVSKFEVASDLVTDNVVGYKNSDLDLPVLVTHGNLIATLLHGPVLAKNEVLADLIIERILTNKNLADAFGRTKRPETTHFAKLASTLAQELAGE